MSMQLSIPVSRMIAHVSRLHIPIYHPWAMNILRKKKKSREPVPSHLKGVYGVDLSSHVWYCCDGHTISTGTIACIWTK